jgi:tetratricopeptide (TPR) repeat protein
MGAETKTNPHYQTALRFYAAFEYEEALRALEKGAHLPSNTREDDVSIALLEGVLAFELQQSNRGESAFRRALKMDPGAKLTLNVSPKIAAELEEVRKGLSVLPTNPGQHLSGNHIKEAPRASANLKLPVAIGGGTLAVGGLVVWMRGKLLEGKVQRANPDITSRAQLDDMLGQAKTFEKVGWALMGVGTVAVAGSLLLLDSPPERVRPSIIPMEQGAHVSLSWSLP